MEILQSLSVVRFADGEARYQMKTLPIEGRHNVRRDIRALRKLACLKQRLGAPQQADARIERYPDGHAVPQLAVAAGELEFRQLPNHDGIVRLRALKVFKTREHGIEGKRRPMLGDESHRVIFREDGLVE